MQIKRFNHHETQQALTGVYDAFAYQYLVDYNRWPLVPLRPKSMEWVRERLVAMGFSPQTSE